MHRSRKSPSEPSFRQNIPKQHRRGSQDFQIFFPQRQDPQEERIQTGSLKSLRFYREQYKKVKIEIKQKQQVLKEKEMMRQDLDNQRNETKQKRKELLKVQQNYCLEKELLQKNKRKLKKQYMELYKQKNKFLDYKIEKGHLQFFLEEFQVMMNASDDNDIKHAKHQLERVEQKLKEQEQLENQILLKKEQIDNIQSAICHKQFRQEEIHWKIYELERMKSFQPLQEIKKSILKYQKRLYYLQKKEKCLIDIILDFQGIPQKQTRSQISRQSLQSDRIGKSL